MQKIVINRCYGGFGISIACAEKMAALGSEQAKEELKEYEATPKPEKQSIFAWFGYGYSEKFPNSYKRTDPHLIQAIEELGSKEASGSMSELHIVSIPDGISWEISDYDGMESIHETHSVWY